MEGSQLATSGVIKRMRLQNFLCHSNLAVEFGPNVNFVGGLNGSGKSAILLGLCVCLGAKAKDTKRVTNIRHMVKNGEDRGRVFVTILNGTGPDDPQALEWDKYGPEITIIRTINATGVSVGSYKIENARGVKVGERKSDIDRIMNHFNILVHNPCVVLNQEMAKEFLKSNSSKDRYVYFLKATLLEDMERELEKNLTTHKELKESVEARVAEVKDLAEKKEKADAQLKRAGSLHEMESRMNDLCLDLTWAKVIEAEAEHAALETDLQTIRKNIAKNEAALEAKIELLNEAIRLKDELAKEANTDELTALNHKSKYLKHEIDGLIRRKKTIAGEIRAANSTIQICERKIVKLKDEIAQGRASADGDASELAKHQHDLQVATEELDVLKDEDQANRHEIRASQNDSMKAAEVLKRAKQSRSATSNEITRLKTEHGRLTRGQHDRAELFGKDSKRILSRIDDFHARNAFTVKPMGPIGSYVKVKDQKHALAIDHAIHGLLETYLVNDYRDLDVMNKIFKELRLTGKYRPNVIVSKRTREKYTPRNRPGFMQQHFGNLPTVLDELVVDEPWIYNILIDNARVERNFICDLNQSIPISHKIRENREASSFLSRLYELDGVYADIKNGTAGAGPSRFERTVLAADFASQIHSLENKIADLERDMLVHSDDIQGYQNDIKESDKVYKQHMLRSKQLTMDIMKKENETQKLEELVESGSRGFDAEPIEDEIAEQKQQIQDASIAKERFEEEYRSNEESTLERTAERDEVAECVNALREKLEKLEERMTEAHAKVDAAQASVARRRMKIADHSVTLESYLEDYRLSADTVAKALEFAESGCPRREVQQSSAKISTKIDEIRALKIAEEEALQGGTFHEIEERAATAQVKYDAARVLQVRTVNTVKRLKHAYRKRRDGYKEQRKKMSREIRWHFAENLKSQGFSGDLKFDHKARTLELEFDRGENSASKAVSSFSGGERSFSTLCFVFAIGSVIDTPLVALDEFDVFMDAVNRQVSTMMLLKFGQFKQHRQFVFITPNDLSMVELNPPFVNVLRLEDPKRQQEA